MFPIRDSIPTRSVPVVTRAIILLNVLVFSLELALPPDALERFFFLFGVVPARLIHPNWAATVGFPGGAYWTLLTHQFLHGGWLHIISNMWALWIFGDNVEDAMGGRRFALFYLTCGILAALTQVMTQQDSEVPSIGASGAIAGVLGAYFLLYPTARMVVLLPIFFFPFFFEVPAVLYLGVWFLTQLFSGTLALASPEEAGGIAFWAHIGGFLSGMLLCAFFVQRGRRPLQPDEYGLWWAWRR
ncbi:MAG TPA: rhomboid family intramembrane serine protease [Verrucomicrobiae bacterium]|nr:rhomboid family intramembrane serine protease [Verrucomicrobiae bacterium]